MGRRGWRRIVTVIILTGLAPGGAVAHEDAADDPVTAAFSGYDPQSALKLDHSLWSNFLSKTVYFAGHATERMARTSKGGSAGTKFRFGNNLPSRFENNRIVMQAMTPAHQQLVTQYRAWLQSVPSDYPLSLLNRGEQLAYWLNLYNARVLELLIDDYPVENTRHFRKAPDRSGQSLWDEKGLKVAGVALSLRDIETRILFPIWNDPLVLYGLWQGAIGGPRLPGRAYDGERVWSMLRGNAREFINSNRAARPSGQTLQVSMLYGWGAPLFKSEAHLITRLQTYAQPPFSYGMEAATAVKAKIYDWYVADLSGGSQRISGRSNPAGFVFGVEANNPSLNALASTALRNSRAGLGELSPATIELVAKMNEFDDRVRQGEVTIEECSDQNGCGGNDTD